MACPEHRPGGRRARLARRPGGGRPDAFVGEGTADPVGHRPAEAMAAGRPVCARGPVGRRPPGRGTGHPVPRGSRQACARRARSRRPRGRGTRRRGGPRPGRRPSGVAGHRPAARSPAITRTPVIARSPPWPRRARYAAASRRRGRRGTPGRSPRSGRRGRRGARRGHRRSARDGRRKNARDGRRNRVRRGRKSRTRAAGPRAGGRSPPRKPPSVRLPPYGGRPPLSPPGRLS